MYFVNTTENSSNGTGLLKGSAGPQGSWRSRFQRALAFFHQVLQVRAWSQPLPLSLLTAKPTCLPFPFHPESPWARPDFPRVPKSLVVILLLLLQGRIPVTWKLRPRCHRHRLVNGDQALSAATCSYFPSFLVTGPEINATCLILLASWYSVSISTPTSTSCALWFACFGGEVSGRVCHRIT